MRQSSRVLALIGTERSHKAVRLWVHKFGKLAVKLISREKASLAVVDKTTINVSGARLWVAIDPRA